MWIATDLRCCMEHMMLWTCFETPFKAEKPTWVSLWELNFSPRCLPELRPQICPELSPRTPQIVWNLLPLLLQMKLTENMILFYLILYRLSFLFIYPKTPFEISGQIHSRPEATGSFSTSSFFNKLLSKPRLCFKAGYNIPEPWGFAELWVSKWKPDAGSLFHNPCSSLT